MLNTGLLLKKPEESSYGRFCRFLIANQTINSNRPKFRKALINQIRDKLKYKFRINHKVTSQELSAQFERIFIKHNSINSPFPDLEVDYRKKIKIRNCHKCAQIGYHSDLFNLPWVKSCPIHQIRLSKYCPECKQPWSVPSNLYSNTCQECGININPDLLIKRNGFLINDRYNDLIHLRKILKAYYKSEQTLYFFDENGQELIDKRINSETDFIPTLICLNLDLKEDSRNILKKFGASFYKYFRVRFYCTDVNSTNTEKNISNRIKENINRSIYSNICRILNNKTKSKHRIGKCIRNHPDNENACIECKTWAVFRDLIIDGEYNYFLSKCSYTNYKSYQLYGELSEYHKTNNLFHLPKIVTQITVLDKKSLYTRKTLVLPVHIQALIYSIDLWSVFYHLYQSFINSNEQKSNGQNDSSILFYGNHLNKFGSTSIYTCPFYVSENNNIVNLTVPKSLLKYNSAYSTDIMNLLFQPTSKYT